MISPDFIIAGERRSGSTTLYEILKQHSQVGMLDKQDFDYFIEPELFAKSPPDPELINNWSETHSLEEYQQLFEGLKGTIGQKDADLLWWWESHKRLSHFLPGTKFVFILRDPVKRAESQYFNELSKGREQLSFQKALEREEQNELTTWQRLHLQYKARGCYITSLNHFFDHIDPSRVKVIILEDLFQNWDNRMKELCEFLSIDVSEGIRLKPIHSNKEQLLRRTKFSNILLWSWAFNLWDRFTEVLIVRCSKQTNIRNKWRRILRGWYYTSDRSRQELDSKILRTLKEYYKPFNKELEKLLGQELVHW